MKQQDLWWIDWRQNPLASIITLNDAGRLHLRYKIAVDAIHEANALINLELTHEAPKEGRWIDRFEFMAKDRRAQDSESDAVIALIEERATKWYEPALADIHCGDCTCVPMSCMKCQAEDLLGVYTTEGLGKHPGHHMQSAYSDGRKTFAEALHWLKTSPVTAAWEGWEAHKARWEKERAEAVSWLEDYGDKYGFR